tara:strand:- start:385 stop:744 length:360 start_codon:yes stop_codon:yes gene_type:complete
MAIRIADITGGTIHGIHPELVQDSYGTGRNPAPGISPLAKFEKALEVREFSLDRHRFLLLLRFLLVNLFGFALLGAAFLQDWVSNALAADSTGMVVLILAFFSLDWCFAVGKFGAPAMS